jgi:acetyltransferase-like isoleucine patch superfamily enzyme
LAKVRNLTNAIKVAYSICLNGQVSLGSERIHPTASVDNIELLSSDTRVGSGAKLTGEVATSQGVFIESNAIIIGPVRIGKGSYIGMNCVIGFPDAEGLRAMLNSGRIEKKTTFLGEGCIVRPGTTIYSDVKVGNNVSFGHNVLVREAVSIGDGARIGTNVVVDGKTAIGSRVSIQTGVYICTYSTVEDGVFLGPCCVFTNDKYVAQKPFKLVGPKVKRGASIGANALLFPGVTVGEGAVVGSQAMVNKNVPPRTIFVGIPAKKMKKVPKNWRSEFLVD